VLKITAFKPDSLETRQKKTYRASLRATKIDLNVMRGTYQVTTILFWIVGQAANQMREAIQQAIVWSLLPKQFIELQIQTYQS